MVEGTRIKRIIGYLPTEPFKGIILNGLIHNSTYSNIEYGRIVKKCPTEIPIKQF